MSGTTVNEGAAAGGLPRGVTPPSGRGGRFLSDVIVELGFAEREAVEQAFEASRAPGKKLGSTLVEMEVLSEHELARAVAERYRLDYLDLEEFEVDPDAARVIGDKEMKRYEAAPVAFTEDGALVVAMVDPADWLAAEEIAQLTGRRVRRAVASAVGVAQVIARVAEADADGEEEAGDAFDDRGPAPARLTLRRVTNPLGRSPAPPAPGFSESTAEAQAPVPSALEPPRGAEAPPPALAGVEPERHAEEFPSVEEPGVDQPARGDGSAQPADELPASEAVGDAATDQSPDAPPEHGPGRPDPDAEAAIEDAEPEADAPIEEAEPEAEAMEQAAPSTPPAEDLARTDPEASDAELDQARRDLTIARAELEATRADRARVDEELRTTRGELASTRSELISARGRLEGALKQAADAEREVGEARAGASRLEVELAAAREQVESLRTEVSWARRQIEQRDERENQAVADLRARVEVMQATPAVASQPEQTEQTEQTEQAGPNPSSDPASGPAPVPTSTAPSNGADPTHATTPVDANDHPTPAPNRDDEGGTAKARGLKRLIAAVRRL